MSRPEKGVVARPAVSGRARGGVQTIFKTAELLRVGTSGGEGDADGEPNPIVISKLNCNY